MKAPKGYKFGNATKIQNCCREIRIFDCKEVGQILTGYNMNTEEQEEWLVIKKHKKHGESTVQRILTNKNR